MQFTFRFYGSCETPFVDPITCTAGPIANWFGPQNIVSACLQVAAFMLGMWTMNNIGEIMMSTEKAPVYVGVPEGYAVLPDVPVDEPLLLITTINFYKKTMTIHPFPSAT